MAALNLQTMDEGFEINSAFFEQNSGCGYVLKPVSSKITLSVRTSIFERKHLRTVC